LYVGLLVVLLLLQGLNLLPCCVEHEEKKGIEESPNKRTDGSERTLMVVGVE
jgi:hypothetical protein